MRICALCQTDKPETAFRKFGRGRKKVCIACETGVTGEADGVEAEVSAPVVLKGSLEVPAGYGFRASIEDDTLCIEQDRAGDDGQWYTYQLSLARHEAAKLIDWVSRLVEREPEAA